VSALRRADPRVCEVLAHTGRFTPLIKAAAVVAGLSVNAYVVRAARRAATLDAAQQLAELGLGDDLAGEGDAL
jgi:hypothetical protein